MLRRLFLIPALAMAGIGVLASSAKAQTVNFTGVVPSACTWGVTQPGTLWHFPPVNPTTLSSDLPGGTSATIEITCANGGDVTIADPVAGGNPMGTTDSAWVIGASGQTDSPTRVPGSPPLNINPGTETLNVHMEAISPGPPLIPGTYNFTVTLTAIP